MVKISTILVGCLACSLFFANGARAQIDPDPDGIGIYFDMEATIVTAVAGTGDYVQAYLVGTNLSHSGDIDYWESHVGPDQGASVSGDPYGSYNYAMNMPGDPSWHCIALSPDPPLPAQEITLLASLDIYILDGSGPIGLYVSGVDRYRIFGSADEHSMYPSSGSPDLPVATINGDAPVPVATGTWGAVKLMYR